MRKLPDFLCGLSSGVKTDGQGAEKKLDRVKLWPPYCCLGVVESRSDHAVLSVCGWWNRSNAGQAKRSPLFWHWKVNFLHANFHPTPPHTSHHLTPHYSLFWSTTLQLFPCHLVLNSHLRLPLSGLLGCFRSLWSVCMVVCLLSVSRQQPQVSQGNMKTFEGHSC